MTPRGKGEGSLYQDSRGYWRASVELPPTVENGELKRRRRVVVSKSKRDAMVKLRAAQKDLTVRGDLSTKTMTLGAWIDKWLRDIAPTTRTPKTMAAYKSTLTRHIVPRLGARRLDRLTPGMIRDAIHDIQDVRSSGTARNAHSYLSAVLTDAVNDGWISSHPMEHLPLPRAKRKTAGALEMEQAANLLRWLGQQMDKPPHEDQTHGLAPLWVTYLLTGARRGELLALTPDRVDEDGLHLEWQLQRLSPQAIASAPKDYEYQHLTDNFYRVRPKSAAGWRSYPLVEPLKSFLHRVIADAPDDGLLFRRDEMTLQEVRDEMSKPANANRAAVLVYEEDGECVAHADGKEFRWSNPFGLDSKLEGYAPRPRNLYLVSKADAEVGLQDGEADE